MMKRIGLTTFVWFIFQLGLSASDAITCESFDQPDWSIVGRVKTCIMQSTTVISSEGVSISQVDSSVLGLNLAYNKKISFLPIRVDETFPNLAAYGAQGCSFKTVSKLNFRNLKNLRVLGLSENQIERIDTDIFEDLTSLEFLNLVNNKIKRMDGGVFAGLSKLTEIYLRENICINRDFRDADAIASLSREVFATCGLAFDLETISSQQNEQKNQIESLSEKVFKENRELSLEVANLKAQLTNCEGLKQQSDVTVRYLSNEVTKMAAENSAMKAALSSTAESNKLPRTK